MGSTITIKLLRAVITLWLTVTLVFVFLRMAGDPAAAMVPPDAGQEVIDQLREKWGFDKPLHVQYYVYFKTMLGGDFGYSIHTGQPVTKIVAERLPSTLQLGGTALLIAIGIGILLGITAALKHNTLIDRMVMSFAVFAFAMPNFFFGLILILAAALIFETFVGAQGGGIWGLLLPAATLGLANMGVFARFTRSSMLETLNKPFVAAARAKGVGHMRVVFRHALPNAAIPIVTLVGLSLGSLIAGSVVTEKVFSWPGVGSLLVRSVETRDLAIVQYIVLLVATTMVAANVLVDLTYMLIDPRIKGK
jgi:peptide/nickel transport system permease protein